MKLKIIDIYSKSLYKGLLIGKPKEGYLEKELLFMKNLLKDSDKDSPILNFYEDKWTVIDSRCGTWGHLTGVVCEIKEGYDNYLFSVIFNFCPETEKLEDKLQEIVSKVDYKKESFYWDIGDL